MRFADVIVIMAVMLQDLQQMLKDLADSSVSIGLWMNLEKFNEYVLVKPVAVYGAVMTYGAERWALTARLIDNKKDNIFQKSP